MKYFPILICMLLAGCTAVDMNTLMQNPFEMNISTSSERELLPTAEDYGEVQMPDNEHYVMVNRDQEPGWYCINVTGGTYKLIFRKKASDYCRCFWATVDYPGEAVSAHNCAPEEWGCYSASGTLSPAHCWNFANCTKDGGTLYRQCGCGNSYFSIDVPEGMHELCGWVSCHLGDCPGKNCWTVEIQ